MCVQVRKFKAINTGSLGVTFAMDNKTMEKSGFTVSPDKVPLLAGAPAHASLELSVTLQVRMSLVYRAMCKHHPFSLDTLTQLSQ